MQRFVIAVACKCHGYCCSTLVCTLKREAVSDSEARFCPPFSPTWSCNHLQTVVLHIFGVLYCRVARTVAMHEGGTCSSFTTATSASRSCPRAPLRILSAIIWHFASARSCSSTGSSSTTSPWSRAASARVVNGHKLAQQCRLGSIISFHVGTFWGLH